jgi:hypothetical protein
MFSPLENEELDRWFQRLNAPLKRLPSDERTAIHLEVRQHLEALAKANEELGSSLEEAWEHALTQFGDPGRFGKKMVQEWQQKKPSFRADMVAIFACLGLEALMGFGGSWVIQSLAAWWANQNHYAHSLNLFAITNDISLYALPIAILVLMGRKFPFQALKSVFYVRVFSLLCRWLFVRIDFCFHPSVSHPPLLAMVAPGLLWTPVSLIMPYLASVTRRGWYRPSWADFKITLPQRRRRVG